jgi:hypothetical protein
MEHCIVANPCWHLEEHQGCKTLLQQTLWRENRPTQVDMEILYMSNVGSYIQDKLTIQVKQR